MKQAAKSLIGLIHEFVPRPAHGAEIGVFRGNTTVAIGYAFPDCEIVGVDLWQEWPSETSYGSLHGKIGKMSQLEWNGIYDEAIAKVPSNCRFLHESSEQAQAQFPDLFFDFIYIDADHSYEGVKSDLELWYPKVRENGLIAGHDYDGKWDKRGIWGVRRAVDEFFAERGQTVMVRKGLVWGCVK